MAPERSKKRDSEATLEATFLPDSPESPESLGSSWEDSPGRHSQFSAVAEQDQDDSDDDGPPRRSILFNNAPTFDTLDYEMIENAKLNQQADERDHTAAAKRWYGYTGKTFSRWCLTFALGITVGLLAFSIIKLVDFITNARAKLLEHLFAHNQRAAAFVLFVVINLAMALAAVVGTLWMAPKAAGSGIPEVKAYLNGVRVPGLLKLKCFMVKVAGTVLSVASCLVVGPEGPLVHIGAMVGGMLTYGRKKFKIPFTAWSFTLSSSWLLRFRNDLDRRDFVSIGTAAGFAAAFGAPVGGVLFALEETSSFWSPKLMWRMMSATMLSTFTLSLMRHGSEGDWGNVLSSYGLINLTPSEDVADYQSSNLPVRLLCFMLIGVWGGLFGGLFTRMWRCLNPMRPKARGLRVLEVAAISVLTSVVMFSCLWSASGHAWGCTACCRESATQSCDEETKLLCVVDHVDYQFGCSGEQINKLAYVFLGSKEKAIDGMLNMADSFATLDLLCMALVFYFGMLITFGLGLPQGIFMPSIMIGVSWGLLFSKLWNEIPGASDEVSKYDFGLMGACAILGGIQHSSISLVVILLEGTGQARYLLAIMLTTITAKSVSALIEHGVYEVAIELKSMPYLDMNQGGRWMAGLTAQDLCGEQRKLCMLPLCLSVEELLHFLEGNSHNGFPVLAPGQHAPSLQGIVLRSQLYSLLEHKRFKSTVDTPSRKSFSQLEFEALQVPSRYTMDATVAHLDLSLSELRGKFAISDDEMKLWVDVEEVMNCGPYTVGQNCALSRVVRLFGKLGLRHLVVLGEAGAVRGIVTRHDILRVQEKHHGSCHA